MGRRLVAEALVRDWDARLGAAAKAAWSATLPGVETGLRALGVAPAGVVAASGRRRAALAVAAAAGLWSADAWRRAVAAHVAPVAAAVTREADSAARAAMPAGHSWGAPATDAARSAAVVALAVAAGDYIGRRLEAAASGPSPADASGAVLSTAEAILSGTVGSAATMAAGSAERDLLDHAAAQGLFDIVPTVTWNAVNDDATREWHADADGQTVGVDEPFEVGGEQLMYPGDPAGSDENTINCRCWLTYEGVDEAGQAEA